MTTSSNDIPALLLSITGNVRVSARRCMPLGLQLQHCAPADLTPVQRERLDLLVERAKEVDEVLSLRERGSSAVVREPRFRAATAWNLVHTRLTTNAGLPSGMGTDAVDAQRILVSLFPDGVAFTQLIAAESWQHGRRLLQRIEDEGHRARLDELVGPIFLRNVEVSVDGLGEAIGVRGEPTAQPSPRALADAVSRFSFAVGGYGRALAVDIVEDDEATVERVLAATAPISELRVTRGAADGEDDLDGNEDEPSDPAPSPAPVTDPDEDPSEPSPFTG